MDGKLPSRFTSSRGCPVREEGPGALVAGSEEGLGQLFQQGREVPTSYRGHQQQR